MSKAFKRKSLYEVERPNSYDPSADIFAPQTRTIDVSENRRRVDQHIHSPTKRLRPDLQDVDESSNSGPLDACWETVHDLATWNLDLDTAVQKFAEKRYPASVSFTYSHLL